MVSMICHCIGNTEDNVRADNAFTHRKEGRFISISSPVEILSSRGVAIAGAYKGLDEACITWLGDGTQSDYHYALNFASTFKSFSTL